MDVELWATVQPMPGVREACELEAAGWDGVTFGDSQCLMGDAYIALSAAALTTDNIRLGIGVTNPWTRHPAVTAAAVMSAHIESRQRVTLGIGRGDSSLTQLGLDPVPVSQLIAYTTSVQTYLRGEAVPPPNPNPQSPLSDASQPFNHRLAALPGGSRLNWLDRTTGVAKPEVFVAASGPRVIRAAAATADVTALTVGADPERLRQAAAVARETKPDVRLAAFIHVVVDDDTDRARAMSADSVVRFARFSPCQGSDPTPDFLDTFAVLGPASHCLERLLELAEIGIERFHVVAGCAGDYRKRSYGAFARDVIPALRAHAARA
ncbi:LLM class flavin-dependent oxidoreductase [Streptomyces sp. Ac-502]|uniref:LLM class flavin-dependent oxidoreductase n=1 Tax=Streptomyces sp. Ac-502 TaxID=3342801 RepID=UPI003862417C